MADHKHDIEKYLRGELTPAEMHALEKAALDDPFLADALEGAEQLSASQFSTDVAELNQKIKQKQRISPWVLRIAASIAVVFVSIMAIWFFLEQEPVQDLAIQKQATPQEEKADDVTPQDNEPSTIIPSDTKASEEQPKKDQPQQRPSFGLTEREKVSKPSEVASTPAPGKTETSEAELAPTLAEPLIAESKAEDKVSTPLSDVREEKEADAKKKQIRVRGMGSAPAASFKADSAYASIPESHSSKTFVELLKDSLFTTVTGIVSAEDGSPIPGVSVTIKGTSAGTQTDVNGFYQIQSPVPNPILLYAFIGMRSTELKVDKKRELNVKLQEDQTALSEVVVTGYGTSRNTQSIPVTIEAAHPIIGNREFKKYLDENVRYPQEAITKKIQGRVIIEFTVNYNNTLSDFTIIRGIGHGCDEELIRTIKEGPKWIATKSNNFFVNDKVRVRFKFELPKK